MLYYNCDDVALALQSSSIDPRTGNKVLYAVSWIATNPSMIGERNEDWVRREINWFRSGSNRLSDMEAPVPKLFLSCAGEDGKVNSAYGHILFGQEDRVPKPRPLFERIVDSFVAEGKHTRHAVAIISDRNIHTLATYNGRQDFICTNALNCMIDSDDRLHIVAQMRSMDAVFGYRADYSMWDDLMEYLLVRLGPVYPEVTRGNITFQVANLHVYPRHFELLDKWADKIYDDQERESRRVWMDKAVRESYENTKGAFA